MTAQRRRCTARSKQTGRRCKRAPIAGGSVCHYHGGAAPQVQRSARERLAAMVDPAIDALGRLVRQRTGHVPLAAARDVLDRAGLRATDKLQVTMTEPGTGPKWEWLRELSDEKFGRLHDLARARLDGVVLTPAEEAELFELRRSGQLARRMTGTGTDGKALTITIPDNGRDTDPNARNIAQAVRRDRGPDDHDEER